MSSQFDLTNLLAVKPEFKAFFCLALTGLLGSCGGTGQDAGATSNPNQSYSGVVVDGYLARSTVFLDTNNNGTRDPWESYAFTDNEGYYSYNPNTDTDYCASTASAEQAQYCLVGNTERSDVVVRIDGGYDILTGEPFLGQLSRRIDASVTSERRDSVITPITSLLTNVTDTSDRSTLLNAIGVRESDLDVDYLNVNGEGAIDTALLNTALKVHKTVSVLSDRLTDTYTIIGDEIGTPNDASSAVYPDLASQIISSGLNFDEAVQDSNVLAGVLDAAEEQLRQVYERKDLTPPADLGDVSSPGAFSRVIDITSDIPALVDRLVNPDTVSSNEDAVGVTRALESVVVMTVNNNQNTSIDNAIEFFSQESNDELIEALTQALASNTADVSSLSANDFTGDDFDSVGEIASAASLPEDTVPFSSMAGFQLKVSDLDLGVGPADLKDSEVEFYFVGEQGGLSGAFTACAKYIDGANVDGSLGEGNTRGELLDGFWSLLGATEGNDESYSLLLTITFLGATYQAIMKPAGTEQIDDTTVHRIRFDNDGDFKVWHSHDGLVGTEVVPATSAECEARLPSRVGL